MRFAKQGALILLAGAAALACAAESSDDSGTDTGTGGVATGTGGVAAGTGGVATGTGGVATSTGGVATSTGGVATSTGGVATSTGGTTNTAQACAEGSVTATATPTVLAWEVQHGADATAPTSTETAAGPVALVAVAGTKDPYAAAILSTWAEAGRQCVDASAFTGVQFTVEGTAAADSLYFKVATSATDPTGNCSGTCYDHFQKAIAIGAAQKVDFSTLAQGGWGTETTFNKAQLVSLVWATTDHAASITIKDVTFY